MQARFKEIFVPTYSQRADTFHPPGWIEQSLARCQKIMRLRRHTFNIATERAIHQPPPLVFRDWPGTVCPMNKTVIEVQVRAVLPTSGGCAVFLGNNDKVFIIYVDQTVGSAITMFMREISKERPLTHDLIGHLMTALGAKVERVIINDLKNATYYARAIIRAENELQQKKIIELDARPSDCIAMATQQKAPIYVSQEVRDEVDDMKDVLRKMEEEGLKPDPET